MDSESKVLKYDDGKPRLDLIPSSSLFAMGKILEFGARKYHDENWRPGMKWGKIFGSAQRHLWSFQGGERLDPESGMPHLWHAMTCLAFLIEYELTAGLDVFDNRPRLSEDYVQRILKIGDKNNG